MKGITMTDTTTELEAPVSIHAAAAAVVASVSNGAATKAIRDYRETPDSERGVTITVAAFGQLVDALERPAETPSVITEEDGLRLSRIAGGMPYGGSARGITTGSIGPREVTVDSIARYLESMAEVLAGHAAADERADLERRELAADVAALKRSLRLLSEES